MSPQSTPQPASYSATDAARNNVADILTHAVEHGDSQRALVVWDGECELARSLTEAYRACMPHALFIEFDPAQPDAIRSAFALLGEGDLVVLIQSTSFRLNAFRIRIELFRRNLKVIEHPHLERMPGPEARIYIDALAYDPDYYRGVGKALKARIDKAQKTVLECGPERLVFSAGMEPAKLNIGDYSNLKNIGGQFPIGEVFTESLDLEAVEGRFRIHFFGDTNYRVNRPSSPITLVVNKGRITGVINSTETFDEVLEQIRSHEGEVWLRELGLGMNRALTPERTVSDIGTFERMCGVHLSLGAKHASYKKPNINKRAARYHVDVFAQVDRVLFDGENVFNDGTWCVPG